jgi:hypothetical protein
VARHAEPPRVRHPLPVEHERVGPHPARGQPPPRERERRQLAERQEPGTYGIGTRATAVASATVASDGTSSTTIPANAVSPSRSMLTSSPATSRGANAGGGAKRTSPRRRCCSAAAASTVVGKRSGRSGSGGGSAGGAASGTGA